MVCIVFVLCSAAAIASPAQILTSLHSFDGSDSSTPRAGLVQASNGNFYGATASGGYNNYYGTIFRLVLPRPCIVYTTVE